MTLRVRIHDALGKRELPAEFPLNIGGGAEGAIQVPGLDRAACRVVRSASHLLVEPTSEGTPVSLNGRRLAGAHRLADGDLLTVKTTQIQCQVSDESCGFVVVADYLPRDTLPPPEASTEVEDAPIEPVVFAPPTASAKGRQAPARQRLLRLALYAGFAGLAAALWFLVTARYVAIKITPQPDRVEISGGLLRVPLGEGYLLRPGLYRLSAEKAGYHRLVNQVTISGERNQVLEFKLNKLPGLLAVRSLPVDGARISIGGVERGTTPAVIPDLTPGRHEVVVSTDRYLDATQTVEIEGRGIRQELVVTLVPRWADVRVESVPSGAVLWVDGQEAGPTPLGVELLAGGHTLELRAPRYQTWTTELEVLPNQPRTVGPITLQDANGTLQLTSQPPAASVTVNGSYTGTTPLELSLGPGRQHSITLSKAGYRSAAHTTQLEAGAIRELSIRLKAITGIVRVTVEPADAQILVNGRPRGKGSVRLSLLAVPQNVTVKKPGFESYRSRVTPRPGYEQLVRATLKPLGAVSLGKLPETITAPDGQRMRLVEPGEFIMGASRREQGRRGNETLRRVALTRPFYVGTQEVSNAQFRRFRPAHSSGSWMGLDLNGNDQPAVNVTWEEAAGYCNWLSERASIPAVYEQKGKTLTARQPLGNGYRLPTEAEWAWAARRAQGQKNNRFPWGNALPPPPRAGNFADQSVARLLANTLSDYSDGYPASAPTARFQANPLGLHDLGGNVAEWTHDYYTIYPYAPDKATKDPQGPREGKHHTVRGSSWMHASISSLRWTYRDYSNKARPDLGFRCARYAR
ncbi:MAG: PEGA domain-containing protein [Gammaproteobacteria bacterium]|nr:PEGA domain-containing protein [Gammaproteobacteria bacterium]